VDIAVLKGSKKPMKLFSFEIDSLAMPEEA
jgi:hypothetical protein